MMPFFASSYIPTGAAVDTRTRDQLYFPFAPRPQAMSIYVRFVELVPTADGSNRFFLQVGNNGTAGNPRIIIDRNGGSYEVLYVNAGGTNRQSTTPIASNMNDTVELLGTITSAGVVTISVSLNGGAVTTGASSAALTLPAAWGTAHIMFNSSGTIVTNFCAYRNVEVRQGIRTMQEMRRYAGTD